MSKDKNKANNNNNNNNNIIKTQSSEIYERAHYGVWLCINYQWQLMVINRLVPMLKIE